MKIRKKLLAIGLSTGLLLSYATPVLAQATTINEKSALKTYTLQDIRALSEVNSTKVLRQKAAKDIAEADKFNAEMNYYDAIYAMMNGYFAGLPIDQATALWDNAIQSYEDAEDALEEAKKQAGYEGEGRYFAYLQLEDSMNALKKTIALQERLLEIEKLKLSLGLSTKFDVQQIQLQVNELKINLEQLMMAKDMSGRELLRQIGESEDTAFELVRLEEYPVLKEKYELDDLIEKATKNSVSLKQLNRAIDNLKEKIIEGGVSVPVREQLAAQADSLMLTRKEVEYSIRLLAKNGIDEINRSQLNLELLKGKVDKAQADYEKTKLQVELGMAPQIALPSSELALITAKQNYQKALDDYYLTLRSLFLLEQGVIVGSSIGADTSASSAY